MFIKFMSFLIQVTAAAIPELQGDPEKIKI
jgi:hypothetical protein